MNFVINKSLTKSYNRLVPILHNLSIDHKMDLNISIDDLTDYKCAQYVVENFALLIIIMDHSKTGCNYWRVHEDGCP